MDDELVAGSRLGLYEIVERVGKSALSRVYKARHVQTSEIRALKVVSTYIPDLAETLKWEFGVSERIGINEFLVGVHDYGEDGDRAYCSMDFVNGVEAEKLVEEKSLSARRSAEIVRDVARGLEHMHGKGFVHADVKTRNILVGDVCSKLCDFGIARYSGKPYPLEEDWEIKCSTHFVSPEHSFGDLLDARADIYMLGATLYHMLTGVPPHEGMSDSEIIIFARCSQPVPVRHKVGEVPVELEDICMKALEKDKDKRFKSAAEFGSAVDHWLKS